VIPCYFADATADEPSGLAPPSVRSAHHSGELCIALCEFECLLQRIGHHQTFWHTLARIQPRFRRGQGERFEPSMQRRPLSQTDGGARREERHENYGPANSKHIGQGGAIFGFLQ
jgi:hypothetical protein